MDFKTRASTGRLHLHQLHPVNGLTIDVIRGLLHFLADTVTKTSQFDTRQIRDKFFQSRIISTFLQHPRVSDPSHEWWLGFYNLDISLILEIFTYSHSWIFAN